MNIAGILLIALAIAFFIVEFFTSGYALFAAAGLLSLILGLVLIFDFAVPPWVTVTLLILILGLSVTAVILIWRRVAEAQKQKVATGHEELIGQKARVHAALQPAGKVFIQGEIWSAELASGQAEIGEEVTVTGVKGLKLFVTKNARGEQ
ncbi:NfeD family protein [Dehalogenimonas sp. 4OHTPN]|uniref:NfeD family protein n=1 Tax=Dehalogenimonas sp. 4OHTPN TaxID=3166643 RepID=A0AAU8G879_9CHLR